MENDCGFKGVNVLCRRYRKPLLPNIHCPPKKSDHTKRQASQKDKHITFEDPQATAADPDGSKYNCQEWIEMLERAREFAYTQSLTTTYPNDSTLSNTLNELSSLSSPSDGGLDAPGELSSGNALGRARLRKDEGNSDGDSLKGGRKRFSKRHSKNGLAAVF